MGNLFSKKEEKTKSLVTEQDKAILNLKQQRDKLKQYQKRINIKLETERQLAKSLLSQNKKEKALLLLRKKKFQESLLSKTDNQLENIEKLVQDIEFAQIESQVFEGLKVGNESLKKMHQILSLEDAEKIMDETLEGIEYQREIDSMLSANLTSDEEDDVLAEFNSIINESEDQNINLPDVPTENLPSEIQKDTIKNKQPVPVLAS